MNKTLSSNDKLKEFIFIIILLLCIDSIAQSVDIENCGLDDDPLLNANESEYFNKIFQDRMETFDFTGKKVAFFTGSSGKTKSTKSQYFDKVRNPYPPREDIHTWHAGGTQILILSEEEKLLSGGYDIILVSWSYFQKTGKARERLIKKLNKRQKTRN